MEAQTSKLNSTKKNEIKNLAFWTGAWVLSMAIASFGPKFLWNENELFSILAIVLNIAVGIGMILANRQHLKNLDELQRKIQLEAMAITLGLAVVMGLAYSLLEQANIISYDAEISHLVILIGITYFGATLIGNSRYQ